jgi:hypothetical protein
VVNVNRLSSSGGCSRSIGFPHGADTGCRTQSKASVRRILANLPDDNCQAIGGSLNGVLMMDDVDKRYFPKSFFLRKRAMSATVIRGEDISCCLNWLIFDFWLSIMAFWLSMTFISD